jgi:hypothetical protein
VRAIVNIRKRGAGIPDGGLFTQQQYERGLGNDAMSSGQLPERGAVEVKGVDEEVELKIHPQFIPNSSLPAVMPTAIMET